MDMQEQLQKFMRDPKTYGGAAVAVEMRQTHISLVYLTAGFAYKIKKPLRLPFLDYSTLEARRQACLAEIELNSVFSTNVYQAVVPITYEADGNLALDGQGVVMEYAVKMRRLDDANLLDHKLKEDRFDLHDMRRLAHFLSSVYRNRPRADFKPRTYAEHMRLLVRDNWTQLAQMSASLSQDPKSWQRLGSQQTLFLRLHIEAFRERERLGALIEGHGDLRPEHVAMEETISLIDGVEFNRDLRLLDRADELSFLSMECAFLGKESIGLELRQAVLADLQDSIQPPLLAFYESYRAMIRAKVHGLRIEDAHSAEGSKNLDALEGYRRLAERRLNSIMPPFVFIVAGAMGSGKTTLARAISDDLTVTHLETDAIRRRLFGQSVRQHAYGEGLYSEEARRQVYDEMTKEMLHRLGTGWSVVVDGTFAEPAAMEAMLEAMRGGEHPYLIVVCECADAVALKRILARQERRDSLSEARIDLYQEQKKRGDWTFAGLSPCRINTECSIPEQLEGVYAGARAALSRKTSLDSRKVANESHDFGSNATHPGSPSHPA